MSPNRRRLLVAAGALLAGTAGCVGTDDDTGVGNGNDDNGSGGDNGSDDNGSDDDSGSDNNGNGSHIHWKYDVRGQVHAVDDGVVYATEDFMEGTGGLVALDADAGEREWAFGETGGYTMYTPPTLADALYFGFGDDAIGSGGGTVHAVEYDGTERWEAEAGSVYDSPIYADGTVYAASDDWAVRAFDAEDGDERWKTDVDLDDPRLSLEAVDAGVTYVTSRDELRALDTTDGDQLWHYDTEDRIGSIVVTESTVYVGTDEGVTAVESGEETWHADGWNRVDGVVDGTVYVGAKTELCGLDADDGTDRWCETPGLVHRVGDEGVYAGEQTLRLVTPDGEEAWATDLESGDISAVSVEDESVYAVTEEAVHRLDEAGEVVATVAFEGIRSHAVGEYVYVGTEDGMYALKL